jgi:chaperonin GroES
MNNSGIRVSGNRVLVKPDPVEEMTEGGILVPLSVKEKYEIATSYGVVVDLGPDCFIHSVVVTERLIDGQWRDVERCTNRYKEPFAKVGDRIAFSIYSGLEQTGEDGEKYKTINDTDITARVSDGVRQTGIQGRKPLGEASGQRSG